MKTIVAFLGLATCSPLAGAAQTAEDQIIEVTQAFFDAMLAKDADGLRAVMLPGARLLAMREIDGSARTSWSDRGQFVDAVTGGNVQLLERMWDPHVMIDGPLATLWTEYDFHRDGRFSHCGIDAFHFTRVRAEWRIAHISHTVRPETCESPLGPRSD